MPKLAGGPERLYFTDSSKAPYSFHLVVLLSEISEISSACGVWFTSSTSLLRRMGKKNKVVEGKQFLFKEMIRMFPTVHFLISYWSESR